MSFFKLLIILTALVLVSFSTLFSEDNKVKNIGILVFDKFLTSDVTAPIEVFGAATNKKWFSEYKVITISGIKTKVLKSEEGLSLTTDYTIYDKIDLDVLIIGGVYSIEELIRNKEVIDYIKEKSKQVKWIASNCAGAFLLGEAGVLDNKKATTWVGGEQLLQDSYPKAKVQFDKRVVVDENVITSNGGLISYQAAFVLLEKLTELKNVSEIKDMLFYKLLENK